MPNGTMVGVKKLFNLAHKGQLLDEFLNEVVLITGIKHRNLIQLKGCCIEYKQRILVYEYVENGNLAEALWGKLHCGLQFWINSHPWLSITTISTCILCWIYTGCFEMNNFDRSITTYPHAFLCWNYTGCFQMNTFLFFIIFFFQMNKFEQHCRGNTQG